MADVTAGNVVAGGVSYSNVSWDGLPDETTKVETPAPEPTESEPESKDEGDDEADSSGAGAGYTPGPHLVPSPSSTRMSSLNPGSTPKGSMVFALGISLLIASAYTSGLLGGLWNLLGDRSKKAEPKNHQDLMWFLGEFLFVMILTFIADTSGSASNVAIALLLVLWLVFITNNNIRVTGWLGGLTPGMK